MDLVANTVMRFAHGPEMHAWFRGTGKNPIVIFVALPAFLEQIEHFLAHGQSTSGILGLSAHDEDRAIDEKGGRWERLRGRVFAGQQGRKNVWGWGPEGGRTNARRSSMCPTRDQNRR